MAYRYNGLGYGYSSEVPAAASELGLRLQGRHVIGSKDNLHPQLMTVSRQLILNLPMPNECRPNFHYRPTCSKGGGCGLGVGLGSVSAPKFVPGARVMSDQDSQSQFGSQISVRGGRGVCHL